MMCHESLHMKFQYTAFVPPGSSIGVSASSNSTAVGSVGTDGIADGKSSLEDFVADEISQANAAAVSTRQQSSQPQQSVMLPDLTLLSGKSYHEDFLADEMSQATAVNTGQQSSVPQHSVISPDLALLTAFARSVDTSEDSKTSSKDSKQASSRSWCSLPIASWTGFGVSKVSH